MSEQMGETSYIYIRTDSDNPLIIELRNDRSKRDGDDLKVYVPADKALVFTLDGRRLR